MYSNNILIITCSDWSRDFIFHFKTGETLPEIQIYDGVIWPNGLMPQLEPNTEYELSVTWGSSSNMHAILTPFKSVE